MKFTKFLPLLVLAALASPARAQTLINSFETSAEIQSIKTSSAQVAQSSQYATMGTHSLQATFLAAAYPTITIPAPAGQPWDWSQTAGLAVDVTNPTDVTITLIYQVEDSQTVSGGSDFRSAHCILQPHQTGSFILPYIDSIQSVNYGMVDLPYLGIYTAYPISGGNPFNAGHIYDYKFSLQSPTGPTTLFFDNVRTIAPVSTDNLLDQYGQSTLTTWTGKASQDSDLTAQLSAEQTDISQHPAPTDRDQYRRLTNGPILTATGWFRTAQYQNKWWLVDPLGHLFFAYGMDSVRALQPTFTTGRTNFSSFCRSAQTRSPPTSALLPGRPTARSLPERPTIFFRRISSASTERTARRNGWRCPQTGFSPGPLIRSASIPTRRRTIKARPTRSKSW